MNSFTFQPEQQPFPPWMGPFSPARGTSTGFRFYGRRLGTWVETRTGRAFWPLLDCNGSRAIANLVLSKWGGGRVLLLPNGFVVKPLPGDAEVGRRVLIGKFRGPIVLRRPDGTTFDMHSPGTLSPGDLWPGPKTTGLEYTIDRSGSLTCSWYYPTRSGQEMISRQLRGADPKLAMGFQKARLGDGGGRVRVTANGHVVTNRQERDGSWVAVYVGWIDPRSWTDWQHWITREDQ